MIGNFLLGLVCALLPLPALLGMRKRQRTLHAGRRRYQDIFEGTGVALCVLDLSSLLDVLEGNRLQSSHDLDLWLQHNPDQHNRLLREVKITEVNQVALQLLAVDSCEGAWQTLIEGCPLDVSGIGYRLIETLLARQGQLELEIKLADAYGRDQHLWLMLRFPEDRGDYRAIILSINDITSRKQDATDQIEASESLRDSEQRYRMLAESISDVIFSTDNALKLNYVSPSVQTVLGYEADWIFNNGWQSTIANPAQLTGIHALLERVSRTLGKPEQLAALRQQIPTQLFLFDCLRADGRKIPIELRLVLVWDEHGNFEGILGVGRDVSQQRRAEKDLRMAATVFEHSTSAILITDPAGYIVQANEAFSRVSGYAVSQVLDQLPSMLTVDEHQEAHLRYVLKQLHLRGSWEGEVWLKRRSGEHYPAWVGITAVFDDEGDLASYVCFFQRHQRTQGQ